MPVTTEPKLVAGNRVHVATRGEVIGATILSAAPLLRDPNDPARGVAWQYFVAYDGGEHGAVMEENVFASEDDAKARAVEQLLE